jgi:hypothetical protein
MHLSHAATILIVLGENNFWLSVFEIKYYM